MNKTELKKILRKMRIHNVYFRSSKDLPRVLRMLERRYRNQRKYDILKQKVKKMRNKAKKYYYDV